MLHITRYEDWGGWRVDDEDIESLSLFSDVSHPSGFASVWPDNSLLLISPLFPLFLFLLLVRVLFLWGYRSIEHLGGRGGS